METVAEEFGVPVLDQQAAMDVAYGSDQQQQQQRDDMLASPPPPVGDNDDETVTSVPRSALRSSLRGRRPRSSLRNISFHLEPQVRENC